MADEAATPPNLGEHIRQSVLDFFATNSGMPLAFVCAVDWIDGSDGANALSITTFENQPTHRSMGMVRYMDSWFEDDACNEMTSLYIAAADEKDED
jgi:hypothetical protein